MKDIELDFINKKMLNNYIDGQSRIVQQVKLAVRSWIGDFFLNDNFGIDYDLAWSNMGLMNIFVREQIEAVQGVLSVISIDITKDNSSSDKTYILNTTLQLESGNINLVEEIKY